MKEILVRRLLLLLLLTLPLQGESMERGFYYRGFWVKLPPKQVKKQPELKPEQKTVVVKKRLTPILRIIIRDGKDVWQRLIKGVWVDE